MCFAEGYCARMSTARRFDTPLTAVSMFSHCFSRVTFAPLEKETSAASPLNCNDAANEGTFPCDCAPYRRVVEFLMTEYQRKRTSKQPETHLFASSFEPVDHVRGVFLVSRAYDGVALDGVLGERAIEEFRLFRVPSRHLRVFQQEDGASVVRLTKGYRARRLVPGASYGGGEISPRLRSNTTRGFHLRQPPGSLRCRASNFGVGKAFAEARGFASVDESLMPIPFLLAKKDRFTLNADQGTSLFSLQSCQRVIELRPPNLAFSRRYFSLRARGRYWRALGLQPEGDDETRRLTVTPARGGAPFLRSARDLRVDGI